MLQGGKWMILFFIKLSKVDSICSSLEQASSDNSPNIINLQRIPSSTIFENLTGASDRMLSVLHARFPLLGFLPCLKEIENR